MQTIVMDMTRDIDRGQISLAGKILREGGLVAFPTETVYGLGGNALDETASEKIYLAKGRPSDNPLIVHIADMASLWKIVDLPFPDKDGAGDTKRDGEKQKAECSFSGLVSYRAAALADAFWPGPLTMILPKREIVPYATTGGLDTVAVRMPAHPAALELIRSGGGYVAAPSANTSGRPSPTKAAHVLQDLDGKIDVVIDGGDVGIGLESTIVDLTETVPMILRPGYISEEMLREVLGEVRMDRGLSGQDAAVRPKAPGMKYRHYAPKGEMYLVEGEMSRVIRRIRELAAADCREGRKTGIIASDESVGCYHDGIVRSAGSRREEITIAAHLYALLREFDDLGVERIYSEAFDTPQMGQAIMNRLLKAAGHQIIDA